MIQLIKLLHSASWLAHDLLLVIGSTLGGWLSSAIVLAAADPTPTAPPANWYEHPAVLAAIFSGLFLLLSKKYETWKAEKKAAADSARDAEDEEDERLLSITEKREELASKELASYLERRDKVHDRELNIEKNLNRELQIQLHESRLIRHAVLNYVQSVHIHLGQLREQVARECPEMQIPGWVFKTYDEMTEGVEDKVERYRAAVSINPEAPKPY